VAPQIRQTRLVGDKCSTNFIFGWAVERVCFSGIRAVVQRKVLHVRITGTTKAEIYVFMVAKTIVNHLVQLGFIVRVAMVVGSALSCWVNEAQCAVSACDSKAVEESSCFDI
jgi:hypothetical protein